MSGGLTRFRNIDSNAMTIDMGGAGSGNVLGQGLYNVELGSTGMPPFAVTLANAFYGCGDASGGNGVFRDGVMDMVVHTNMSITYNSITYSGGQGSNSLYGFAALAKTWGWDVSVMIPPPRGTLFLMR